MHRDQEDILDEWLVLRCQEGALVALNLLLMRWQDRLSARAFHLTGDPEATMDVVQDTLIAIARQIRSLDDPSKFRSWAISIVSNKSRDWVRKRVREKMLPRVIEDSAAAIPETAPESPLDRLREAMLQIAPEDRELLRLHYVEGFTLQEIATIDRIAPGTVKSRLFNARARLKEKIETATQPDRN